MTLQGCWDDDEEARVVGEDIEQLQRQGHALNEMAILVRASFQMRAFEDRFVTLGLNYRVIGGPRFYERQEIRDATAYLDVTLNPSNDLKFSRIVNTPRRGLGDATLKVLHGLARAEGIPLALAARTLVETEELRPAPRRALADLIATFDRWRSLVETMRHTELAELILDESGYTAMWQNDKSPKAQSRLENLKELIRFMDEFDSLAGFLEHVSLVMDAEAEDGADRVSLMTLHSAKGLEFDNVFLAGWEEVSSAPARPRRRRPRRARGGAAAGLCGADPRPQRAKVTFTQNRRLHGLWQSAIPSRFIDELPEAHVEIAETSGAYGSYGMSRFDEPAELFQANYGTPGWQRAQRTGRPPPRPSAGR